MPQIDMLSGDPAHTTVPETSPSSDRNSLTHDDYTIGWMCALPIELTAATAMLDQIHPDLPKANAADSNTYTLGSIGSHNIALAGLPSGSYGTNSAAVAASHMLSAFPNLRFGLMVGIGGGAPSEDHDIRLGDIVVSRPQGKDGGVVQIDLGKATGTGFKRTGTLNRPPTALLTALTKLEAEHFGGSEKIPVYVGRLHKKYPRKAKEFAYRLLDDNLYQPDYEHKPGEKTCRNCDTNELVCRENRDNDSPVIHYGTIASSNQVIKHGPTRDRLQREHEALCFEMEAAGLMNDFPCIVIRGVCDYADSHKNKRWQPYAAAVAAAYARELLEQIPAKAVESIGLAMEIASLRKEMTRTVTSAVTHGLRSVQDDLGKRKSNDILDWLSQSNHEAKYADIINSDRYKEGTSRWFLDSPEFETWCRKPGETLFCPGIPGAGKTIMASLVIQNLFRIRSKSIVAFLYCEYGRKDEQTTDDLLTALLRQFSQEDRPLPSPISSLHTVCRKEKRRPRRDEVGKTLTAVAESYDRAFVIIDALDECSEQTRGELLFLVRHLQKETSINLLATSRPLPQIEGLFDGDLRLPIQAHESDIEIYSQSRLQGLPDWVREDEALQRRIQKDISRAVNGMFLLARLHFDSLKGKQTQAEIEEALDAFQHPQGKADPLKIAYDGATKRIANQTPGEIMWAQKVLSWVVLARRPLSPTELQHALGVRPGDRELNTKNFPHPASIVSLCAGLVLISQESNIVQLVHYTTKEYFENNPPEWIQSAKVDLARSCLQYLTLNDFADGPCLSDGAFKERTSKHAFFSYAACFWGEHSQGVETEVEDVAQTFLSSYSYTSSATEAANDRAVWKGCRGAPQGWSMTHTIAFYGLTTWFPFLLDQQSDHQNWWLTVNEWGHGFVAPLYLAAQNGHEDMVEMLLMGGASVAVSGVVTTTSDPYRSTTEIASTLETLSKYKDGTSKFPRSNCGAALCVAAENGHEAIFKMLIDHKDIENVSLRDSYGAALRLAARNGQEAIVKMLIDLGDRVDVNAKDQEGRTPLCEAASYGHEAVAKILLNIGDRVDVRSRDEYGRTPLNCAIKGGHEAVAKILRDKGGCQL